MQVGLIIFNFIFGVVALIADFILALFNRNTLRVQVCTAARQEGGNPDRQ